MANQPPITNPTTIKRHNSCGDGASTINRRRMLTMTTAIAIANTSPALAFPSVWQDAELIELGRQLEIIDIQYREASEASSRIHGEMENQYPALPEVLKARETDKQFQLPKPNDGEWYRPVNGGSICEPGYYTTCQLNELKQCKPYQRKETPIKEYRRGMFGPDAPPLFLDDEVLVSVVPWPEAQARVDELIAAIEVWGKAVRKIRHASGYMKAEREYTRIGNKHNDLLNRIAEIDAKSLQGILVKARAVKAIHADEDAIEFGRCTDEVLAASILNELLALQA
jgi:hypothetical protein